MQLVELSFSQDFFRRCRELLRMWQVLAVKPNRNCWILWVWRIHCVRHADDRGRQACKISLHYWWLLFRQGLSSPFFFWLGDFSFCDGKSIQNMSGRHCNLFGHREPLSLSFTALWWTPPVSTNNTDAVAVWFVAMTNADTTCRKYRQWKDANKKSSVMLLFSCHGS